MLKIVKLGKKEQKNGKLSIETYYVAKAPNAAKKNSHQQALDTFFLATSFLYSISPASIDACIRKLSYFMRICKILVSNYVTRRYSLLRLFCKNASRWGFRYSDSMDANQGHGIWQKLRWTINLITRTIQYLFPMAKEIVHG